MKLKKTKVRNSFCIFFSLFCIAASIISVHGEEYKPDAVIYSKGKRTAVDGTHVSSVYGFYRTGWNSVTNTAQYNVSSYYDFEGTTTLYSDKLLVNGTEIGIYSSNNGVHGKGTIQRTEIFKATLKSGINKIKTENVNGIGGDSTRTINIRQFATPPKVTGHNSVWKEGDVALGIRTWESVYTDGATGSAEGNKASTSSGFKYEDVDEQTTPVHAYSDTQLGRSTSVKEIIDLSTNAKLTLGINIFRNPGRYSVESCTKDSGGLIGCGKRIITVLKNDPPVITGTDKTFYEGQYSHEYWINTLRWSEMSAMDNEDGNIASKVNIIYDNVSVNTPGNYKVVYSVTDSGGKTAQKEINVNVLYNNPPTISSEDRWFYIEENITNEMLMERVKANDIEDGDITSKAIIKSSNVQSGVIGDYIVTYEITDAFGKSAESIAQIHVVSNTMKDGEEVRYLRFIQANYMDTLKEKSIWKHDEYYTLLQNTVEKEQDNQAVEIWHVSAKDIEKMKDFDKANTFSKQSAEAFYNQFRHVIKEAL